MEKDRYAFICPNCKSVCVGNGENGSGEVCQNCGVEVLPTGITEADWDAQSKDEMELFKTEFASKLEQIAAASNHDALMNKVSLMESHLKTIKNILIFFLATAIIAAMISVIPLFALK